MCERSYDLGPLPTGAADPQILKEREYHRMADIQGAKTSPGMPMHDESCGKSEARSEPSIVRDLRRRKQELLRQQCSIECKLACVESMLSTFSND